jgi:hypothetical protein
VRVLFSGQLASHSCVLTQVDTRVVQVDAVHVGEEEAVEAEQAVEGSLPDDAHAMDARLDAALLQALRTTVTDKSMPLTQGQLWNAHVLPARAAGTNLEVKLSTFKKLGDWLKAKEKQGLIETLVRCCRVDTGGTPMHCGAARLAWERWREGACAPPLPPHATCWLASPQVDKKTKEAKLVKVNRADPLYRAFVPTESTAAAESAAQEEEDKTKDQVRETETETEGT